MGAAPLYPVTAEDLDRELVLLEQRGEPEPGGSGEVVQNYVPLRTVRCKYQPTSGREGFAADSRFSETDARFTIRFDPYVTPKHKLEFEGVVMRIVNLQEIGRRAFLVIAATGRAE